MADELPPLIGESPAFIDAMERVSAVAPLDRPVLVVGERGTGKELVAARLQYLSPRWDRPVVKVNCAALHESLLESELFGHEAGAFTGAVRQRRGRFERADGGTLFLDEIASASAAVQEKVLRIIEYGEFERIGGSTTLSVDVRVVAAANVDLPAEAAAGRFRHDLLDRLAFEVITLPPLRARPDDIPLLTEAFGRTMAARVGWERFPGFAIAALRQLDSHPWPGNVRELRNVVDRAVYRWPDQTEPIGEVSLDPFESPWRPRRPLPEPTAEEPPAPTAPILVPADLDQELERHERGILEAALVRSRHNQRIAARALSLTYHQFRGRLRKHGLLSPRQATDLVP